MRGNLERGPVAAIHDGSIPAHAGEPCTKSAATAFWRVYPRACGGTCWAACPSPASRGLSPRMRGNQWRRLRRGDSVGSIPAHAGEPLSRVSSRSSMRVYPRACGGTNWRELEEEVAWGLSPRMRGNRYACLRYDHDVGSIPAHAGEPQSRRYWKAISGVYPRACGGTLVLDHSENYLSGLSPRMRGNL